MLIARPAHTPQRRTIAPAWRGVWSRARVLELAAVSAIFLVGLLLRTYALDAVPFGLHGDEAVAGLEGQRILSEGNIGPYAPGALGQPSGPLYLVALSVAALGNTIFAVRIVPALLGALTIVALFVVLRRSFGLAAALCGAALLATQGWHVHFSRIGFPVAAWPLCTILATGALIEAQRRYDWRWWAATGLLLGIGLYAYNSHPLFVGISGLFVAGSLVARWWCGPRGLKARQRLLPVLAFCAMLALAASPLLQYATDPANDYASHLRSVSVMQSAEWRELATPTTRAGFLVSRYLGYWDQLCCHSQIDGTDGSGVVPVVPPPLLVLTVAGVVIGWRSRQGRPLASFGLLVLLLQPLGAAMTVDGAVRRTLIVAPLIAAFVGVALAWPLEFVRARWGAGRARVLLLPALGLAPAVIVALLAVGTVEGYFVGFAHSQEERFTFATEIAEASQYLATLPPSSRVLFASGRWSGNYETRQFLAPNVVVEDRSTEYGQRTDFTFEPGAGPPTFVLLGDYIAHLDEIRARYPGGTTVVGGVVDSPSFVAYRLETSAATP